MDISLVIDPDVFEQAKAAARQMRPSPSGEGLYAPVDGALQGRIDEAWNEIESALTKGFIGGKEKAMEAVNKALQKADAIINGAGLRSQEVLHGLLLRLQIFNQKFIQGALQRFPNQVQVSDAIYRLDKISFTQKLTLSGSLALSLEKVFEMVSEGEIAISADYILPKT